jgi:hypothetical protein
MEASVVGLQILNQATSHVEERKAMSDFVRTKLNWRRTKVRNHQSFDPN